MNLFHEYALFFVLKKLNLCCDKRNELGLEKKKSDLFLRTKKNGLLMKEKSDMFLRTKKIGFLRRLYS